MTQVEEIENEMEYCKELYDLCDEFGILISEKEQDNYLVSLDYVFRIYIKNKSLECICGMYLWNVSGMKLWDESLK